MRVPKLRALGRLDRETSSFSPNDVKSLRPLVDRPDDFYASGGNRAGTKLVAFVHNSLNVIAKAMPAPEAVVRSGPLHPIS
jgi:hypothetical protein